MSCTTEQNLPKGHGNIAPIMSSLHSHTHTHGGSGPLLLHQTMSCGLRGGYTHLLWWDLSVQEESDRSVHSLSSELNTDVTKDECPLGANQQDSHTDEDETCWLSEAKREQVCEQLVFVASLGRFPLQTLTLSGPVDLMGTKAWC